MELGLKFLDLSSHLEDNRFFFILCVQYNVVYEVCRQ